MSKGILLEAGTNEMEVLVFRLNNTPFGINVAKVREIIQKTDTIRIPHAPAAVEGSFKLRDRVLTLVNLGKHFNMDCGFEQEGQGMIIVVEFNKITCGVLVETVELIHRMSWDKIEPPSQFLTNIQAPITGTTNINNETVLIADFESIVGEILGVSVGKIIEDTNIETAEPKDIRIVMADDSAMLRKSLVGILNKFGYENLMVCQDGQEAWDFLSQNADKENGPCDLVLTDIEMPRMDGLHLTKKIRDDARLNHLPVILFSSLITEDNMNKGKSVGADAQVSKPDSEEMIQAIEEALSSRGIQIDPDWMND